MEKGKKEVHVVRIATFPHGESLCFILEFLLDYREDNLVILRIRSLFPYQGLILTYKGFMFLRRMRFGYWEIRG